MKKLFALLLPLLFLLCAPLSAWAEPRPIFINPSEDPEVTAERERCRRKVLFRLDGQQYALGRNDTMSHTLADGTMISGRDAKSPVRDCNIIDAGEVAAFHTGFANPLDYNIELHTLDPASSVRAPMTTYDQNKKLLEQAIAARNFARLPDGTRVFTFNKTKIYLLPRNIAPTDDQQPAALICAPDKDQSERLDAARSKRVERARIDTIRIFDACRARYRHDGRIFGYTYFEETPGDHLALDFHIRKKYEALKYSPQ